MQSARALAKTDRIEAETGTFQKIITIAKNERLSFYDSSYIYYAKEKELKLVTEDKKLNVKAQKYVDVQTTSTFISP